MNTNNDSSRFTIRDEAPPDSFYVSEAENLRLEKLSTRVTLVAVLIPCLLVIVLAVAYLDIKNRVVNTQNSGSMGVQNLSKDLESRFSSLSLKQAKLEAQLSENTKALEKANAAMQVNLKKATTEFKRLADSKIDPPKLAAVSKKSEAAITALKKEINDLNVAFEKFDEELAAQIMRMAEGFNKGQGRLAQIEKRTQRLDAEKLSKESMDLALGLERLALQEMVKDKIRGVEKKLAALDKQMVSLSKRWDEMARKKSPGPSTAVPPRPPTAPSAQSPDNSSESTRIIEQTIN